MSQDVVRIKLRPLLSQDKITAMAPLPSSGRLTRLMKLSNDVTL